MSKAPSYFGEIPSFTAIRIGTPFPLINNRLAVGVPPAVSIAETSVIGTEYQAMKLAIAGYLHRHSFDRYGGRKFFLPFGW